MSEQEDKKPGTEGASDSRMRAALEATKYAEADQETKDWMDDKLSSIDPFDIDTVDTLADDLIQQIISDAEQLIDVLKRVNDPALRDQLRAMKSNFLTELDELKSEGFIDALFGKVEDAQRKATGKGLSLFNKAKKMFGGSVKEDSETFQALNKFTDMLSKIEAAVKSLKAQEEKLNDVMPVIRDIKQSSADTLIDSSKYLGLFQLLIERSEEQQKSLTEILESGKEEDGSPLTPQAQLELEDELDALEDVVVAAKGRIKQIEKMRITAMNNARSVKSGERVIRQLKREIKNVQNGDRAIWMQSLVALGVSSTAQGAAATIQVSREVGDSVMEETLGVLENIKSIAATGFGSVDDTRKLLEFTNKLAENTAQVEAAMAQSFEHLDTEIKALEHASKDVAAGRQINIEGLNLPAPGQNLGEGGAPKKLETRKPAKEAGKAPAGGDKSRRRSSLGGDKPQSP